MKTVKTLHDQKIDVKLKIAALWAAFMFLYIYVDYFALYMPGKIEAILQGKVYEFDISTTFLTTALISVSLPALMIFASLALPAGLNRKTNIIMAILYIPYSLFNLAGEAWAHMIYGAVLEVILLLNILSLACSWPYEKN
jgi:hypothetical protein